MIEEIMDDINERKNGIMLNEVKKKNPKIVSGKKMWLYHFIIHPHHVAGMK